MTLFILRFVCFIFDHDWPEDSSERCKCCGVHWVDGAEDFSFASLFVSFAYRLRRRIKLTLWALGISKTCPHCQTRRDKHGRECEIEVPF